MIRFLGLVGLSGFLVQCQSGLTSVTKRGIGGLTKPGTPYMHGRSPIARKKPDIYVKKKSVSIRPVETANETGSLFKMDDQRNHLYAANAPFALGQFLDVLVVPFQKKKAPEGSNTPTPAAQDESSGDNFVKEMLKALPELEPGENVPALIKKLKMKIGYVYENGDALAIMRRSSNKGMDGNSVIIRARIPYTTLISGRAITTDDLVDIHYQENAQDEFIERYSSNWQDEYSLRLSGFNEAKSRYAQQLDDKKQQLDKVKGSLRNQLVSMGKERSKLAKERQQVFDEKAKLEEEKAKLQKQIDARDKTVREQEALLKEKDRTIREKARQIENQKREIEELEDGGGAAAEEETAEKPGDEKDGADGE